MHPRPSRNRKVPARYLEGDSCVSPDITQLGAKRSFEERADEGKENKVEIKSPNRGSLAKRGRKSSTRGARRLNIREPLVKVRHLDEACNNEDDVVVVDEAGQDIAEVKMESINESMMEITCDANEYATPSYLRNPTGCDDRDCSKDKISDPGSIKVYEIDETSNETVANGCNGTYVEEKSEVSNLAILAMDDINNMPTQDIWASETMDTEGSSSLNSSSDCYLLHDDPTLVSDPIKVSRQLRFECTRPRPKVDISKYKAIMSGTGIVDVGKMKKFKRCPVPSTPEVFDQVADDCVPLKIYAHADDDHAQTEADTTWTLVVIGPKVVPFLQKENSSFSRLFPEIVQVTHISNGCFSFRTNLKTSEHAKCPTDIVYKLSRDYVIDATEPVHLMDKYMSTLPQIVFTR